MKEKNAERLAEQRIEKSIRSLPSSLLRLLKINPRASAQQFVRTMQMYVEQKIVPTKLE